MSRQVLSDLDFNSASRIQNLPDANASGQPVTFNQLQAVIEGLAWKDDVDAASVANINLASPGATIDGVTMSSPMRVLLKDQTAPAENGIYVWNGAAVPLTRAADMSVSAEFNAAVIPVRAGGTANANTRWRVTVANPTVGTTGITVVADQTSAPTASESSQGVAEIATQSEVDTGTDDQRFVTAKKLKDWANGPKRWSGLVGDGSATSIVVTHNLNTRDINATVYRNSGSYDIVDVEVRATSTTTATVVFAVAPASNAFKIVITA